MVSGFWSVSIQRLCVGGGGRYWRAGQTGRKATWVWKHLHAVAEKETKGRKGQKAWGPHPNGAGMWKDHSEEKAMLPLSLRPGRAHLGPGYT